MSYPKDVLEEAAAALESALRGSTAEAPSSSTPSASVAIQATHIGNAYTGPVVIVGQTIHLDRPRE